MADNALVLVLDPATGLTHLMPFNLRAVRKGELPLVGEHANRDTVPDPDAAEEPPEELPVVDPENTTEQPSKTDGKSGTNHKE